MPSDQGPSSLHPLQDVSANQEPQSHKFDSYADYLRALLKVYPDKMLTALLAYLNSRKFRSGYKVTFEDEIPQIVHIKHGRCHAYWPTSFPSFDEYLAHPATLPQYQFILVTINNPRRNPYSAQFGNLVNSLGLTFDIPPTIWCQLLYKTPPPGCHSGSYTDYSTKPCQSDSRCFSLGGHLVYITDPSDKSTFKTAIIFAFGYEESYKTIIASQFPSKVSEDPRIGLSPTDTQSRTLLGLDLQYWIQSQSQNLEYYGSGNFLLVCLEGLLRIDLENLPTHIIRSNMDLRDIESMPMSLKNLWSDARAQLDLYRKSIIALPDFVRRNFDMSKPASENAYQQILALCQRCIQYLEITESQQKDILDLIRSEKATEMAELSIQESKRVMLLTALAFIFIPISLAASIFGMNVEQINATGPSITAFIVTAILMIIGAFVLWGATYAVTQHRRECISEYQESGNNYRNWKEILLFVPSKFADASVLSFEW